MVGENKTMQLRLQVLNIYSEYISEMYLFYTTGLFISKWNETHVYIYTLRSNERKLKEGLQYFFGSILESIWRENLLKTDINRCGVTATPRVVLSHVQSQNMTH